MAYPANYRYTREHEWIALEGAIGTIGITDYAQSSLGDIVYVDVPKVATRSPPTRPSVRWRASRRSATSTRPSPAP